MRPNTPTEPKHEVRREHADPLHKSRPPAAAEDVEQFRRWLDQRMQTQAPAHDAHRPGAIGTVELDRKGGMDESMSAEATALLHSHRLVFDVAALPAAPPSTPSAGLAELIEKHVRQMLVSEAGASSGRDARVMLRLSDAMLPGTDLTLTRSDTGWDLRADVSTPQAREALSECVPDLIKRFGDSGLGEIRFESVLRS